MVKINTAQDNICTGRGTQSHTYAISAMNQQSLYDLLECNQSSSISRRVELATARCPVGIERLLLPMQQPHREIAQRLGNVALNALDQLKRVGRLTDGGVYSHKL